MNSFKLVAALTRAGIPIPDYVKEAMSKQDETDAGSLNDLSNHAFAGPGRTYPRHTKEATYISTVQYILDNNPDKGIGRELEKSARFFDIAFDQQELTEKLAATLKTKSASFEKFALVVREDDGSVSQYFPLDTVEQVAAAGAELRKVAGMLPWDMRHKAAVAIMDAARQMDIPVGGYIYKAAQATRPVSPNALIDAVMTRRNDTPKSELNRVMKQAGIYPDEAGVRRPGTEQDMYTKIAMTLGRLENVAELTSEQASAFVAAIDSADRLHDYHKKYASAPTPEEMVYNEVGPKKWSVKMNNGLYLDIDAIQKSGMHLDEFAPMGGGFTRLIGIADLATKSAASTTHIDYVTLATVAETIPAEDATRLMNLVQRRVG